ncbi:T9SS type B sorting domain-containing protein [Flavobacterium difficile]|uniref:T9SS type B sorting domain-containing protein n=1 Tax=Flavobacterium difficile TaxID=2709659 RepID=A0ABX0I409_9FLAO|nr:T9SS type B sorting domain-containing protein [Flavobacterium difficile]NHM00492.1 T9SS type B sorting domain-containing protein [Flavobacterium difficile]
MKNYLFLLSFLTFFISQAQLSNKHWLPPLHTRESSAIEDHYIYISTAEATPFQVNVTTGNGTPIVGSPFTISQSAPAMILIGNGQPSQMFLDVSDVNVVKSDKGLILEGAKDFYVSFRMRQQNHAETLISKGRPGIGTNFRLGSTPQGGDISIRNFVSSVMATEDNTTIVLSDYNTNVEFVSGAGLVTADTQTFVLNEGETVTFSGYTDNIDNWTGFIGASLTATKPVAVNTGNATGGVSNNGSDFTLDQIVSSSQIGTEYIFIEGNGLPAMESPLIIADENNTQVFVNGSTTPAVTLNAGDYYLVPNSQYQGTINRNIYVKASKPVFAYQLIGGAASNPTSGLNFIPPLSCFFQNSVYIPSINQIGSSFYTADLMILTYSTASITVNGTAIPTSQAQTVLGNTDWVTYRIAGYSGNVNVVSTGPLAVGVFGASGAAGYAGYYSGFGSAPQDTPVTVCSSTTTNLFDAIIGNPGAGGNWTVPAGGAPLTGDVFDPASNIPGEYIYSFTKTCNTALTFLSVKVNVTVEQAGNTGTSTTKNTCKNESTFDMFPLLGTGVTTGGTWSFNGVNRPNGDFNPATDLSGTYTYTIPASGVCPALSSTVQVTNFDIPTVIAISDFKVCDDAADGNDTNGQTTFNLTSKNTEIINGQTNVSVTYHLLPNEAISGTNAITSYSGANKIIYVRLFNTLTNCYNTTSFNAVVTPLPMISNPITLRQCDDDTDAISDFNLTEANASISTQANLVFSYFTSPANAQNNVNRIPNETAYTSPNNGTVWARIENENNCIRVAQVNLIVSATQIPATFQKIVLEECDDFIDATDTDTDGFDYFDFSSATTTLLAQFPSSNNLIVTYYENEPDALAELNPIDTTDPDGYRNIVPNLQNIWVRIDTNINNACVGLGQYVDLRVNPLPDFNLTGLEVLCVTPGTGVGSFPINATPATPGNYSYLWTPTNPDTTAGQENAVFMASANGIYKVVVTNMNTMCSKEDQTEIVVSSAPQTVQVELVSEIFASGLSTIQAVVVGGFGSYEYSLNQIDWQTSPVFTNLENDIYTIYVRDINGCGEKSSNAITTISYPNYFTPNGDGYNDTWNIKGLTPTFDAKIYIFDRYGKLLKQIDAYGNGWDGKFNGQEVPSTDYWFKIEYKEDGVQKEFKSHFSLKR